METKTFDIQLYMPQNSLAQNIAAKWKTWQDMRAPWEESYRRVLQYLFSTTTDTIYGQASNPWAANVHIPKLTQLRDVLITYELESLFSMEDYYEFEGFTRDSNTIANRKIIKDLLKSLLQNGKFKESIEKSVTDYIDSGNSFGMPVWHQEIVEDKGGQRSMYWEGPVAKRINPLDIVFDPTAASFKDSPKIIRTVLSIGQVAAMAESDPIMKAAFDQAMKLRRDVMTAMTNGDTIKNDQMEIAGFGNWSNYFASDVVEILTFYGNLYEVKEQKLHKNTKIVIMDRSTILKEEPMDDLCGYDYIFKAGYRDRKDILWAMSPLDNILGMQSRIDFLENKRSDCYDATVNPIKIIKGQVDMPDSTGPGDEIRMDIDADVRYLAPDTTILTADSQIDRYSYLMEEMVGSPKEVLGFRTPGEKTMFEVNQLYTAAIRIFQRQIRKFEVEYVEPMLNAMLQQYLKVKKGEQIELKVWNSEKEFYEFKTISVDDIKNAGKIVVTGSTTFHDKQQIAQALQMLGQNPLFIDEAVRNNFSPSELGLIFNYVSGLDKFPHLFQKDRRLFEITEQQKLVEKLSQQVDEVRAQGLANLQGGDAQAQTQMGLAMQRQGMLNNGQE